MASDPTDPMDVLAGLDAAARDRLVTHLTYGPMRNVIPADRDLLANKLLTVGWGGSKQLTELGRMTARLAKQLQATTPTP